MALDEPDVHAVGQRRSAYLEMHMSSTLPNLRRGKEQLRMSDETIGHSQIQGRGIYYKLVGTKLRNAISQRSAVRGESTNPGRPAKGSPKGGMGFWQAWEGNGVVHMAQPLPPNQTLGWDG